MNDTPYDIKDDQPEAKVAFTDTAPATDPHQKSREEAFDAEHSWKGQTLLPFSSGRKREWIRLRNLDGGDSSSLDDAVKIVFLCLTPTDQLIEKRRNPEALSAEIWRWGDENVGHDENEAILALADKLVIESNVNRAVPLPSTGGESGN